MDKALALIAGESVESAGKEFFDDYDPSTGRPLAEVARCGADDVDRAVSAARDAYERVWRHITARERSDLLHGLAALIRRDRERLALLESRDTGKPLTQARTDADIAARYFQFYGNTIESFYGDTIPLGEDMLVYTRREPYGVTGHIVAWNYPMQIASRTAAPALAAGNCCVVKPAEEASLTVIEIGRLALEAGFPPGVLNIVPGYGEEAGAALAAHPGIDHLAFVGSREVGSLVAKSAADNIVPVTLELGGKSPNIVLPDADLDAAVPFIVNAILQNAGQTCSAGSRLLVHEHVHDQVVGAVAERFRATRIGPGPDDPDLGPLISQRQLERVRGFVGAAKEGEGRLVVGGGQPDGSGLEGGYFFEPTLFDGVEPSAPIAREEVFGPVLVATPFSDIEEAAALANATDYGLIAAVWTQSLSAAHTLAARIRSGQVFINTYGAGGGVELPFGGFKQSGYGREKGYEALAAYTQTKTVVARL